MALVFAACGDNAFKGIDEEDSAEDAVKKLEQLDPEEAEKIALDALGPTYKNIYQSITNESDLLAIQQSLAGELEQIIALGKVKNPINLVSVLSSAKAQIHGIDPFSVALALATDDDEEENQSTETKNEVTRIFPVLPEPTIENIRGLNVAMAVLNSIGASRFSKADHYKSAIFLTSSVSLASKALDKDEDGAISALEASDLTDELAISILTQIASATLAISQSSSNEDGEKSKKNAQAIANLNAKIESQAGDTTSEKLRNFLSQKTSESAN